MGEVIAFIPARCGSKSIPLKNVKDFCGKPLIYWTLKAAIETKSIDRVVVATDCEEIKETVKSFDFSKVEVFERSGKNASDTASTESVMLEYIERAKLSSDSTFVLIQLTNPFLEPKHLEDGLNQFREAGKSVISCVRIKRFFWNENGKPANYDYFNRPRRQDFDGAILENGAFYINCVGSILKFENRLSDKVSIYEMPEYSAVEIDEEDDWHYAENLMRKYLLRPNVSTQIKVVFTDVDGVLTDAGMYYSEYGDETKKFNTLDGMGFELLRKNGYKTGIITSEKTEIVKRRAEKVKVDFLFQGAKNKLELITALCEEHNWDISEVAYIGDDVNCLPLLQNVGLAACPSNAMPEIKAIPNILKLDIKGGDGVFRAFVRLILNQKTTA